MFPMKTHTQPYLQAKLVEAVVRQELEALEQPSVGIRPLDVGEDDACLGSDHVGGAIVLLLVNPDDALKRNHHDYRDVVLEQMYHHYYNNVVLKQSYHHDNHNVVLQQKYHKDYYNVVFWDFFNHFSNFNHKASSHRLPEFVFRDYAHCPLHTARCRMDNMFHR